MRKSPDPDRQLAFPLEQQEAIEREIGRRAEMLAQADAWRWRFRLLTIETVLMSALTLAVGIAVGQPFILVARAAILVGAGCFASGMLLLGLSAGSSRAWRAFKWLRGGASS